MKRILGFKKFNENRQLLQSSARPGSIEEIISDFSYKLFSMSNKISNKDMAEKAKQLITEFNPKIAKFNIQFDLNKINPVMIEDFMKDMENVDEEGSDEIDIDRFKFVMNHWLK